MKQHALLVAAVLSFAIGCHNERHAEGPMERAGRKVDHAADKTGKALGTAAEKTGEAFEKVGKKLKGDDAPAPSSKSSK